MAFLLQQKKEMRRFVYMDTLSLFSAIQVLQISLGCILNMFYMPRWRLISRATFSRFSRCTKALAIVGKIKLPLSGFILNLSRTQQQSPVPPTPTYPRGEKETVRA